MESNGDNTNKKTGAADGMTVITDIKSVDFNDKSVIEKEIDDFVKKYAYADVEHALVISPNGNAYSLIGNEREVNSSIIGKDALEDSICIHNHPIPKGDITGDSFSKHDLMFAAEYKLGKQYVVSGERKNEFLYTGSLDRDQMKNAYKKALDKLRELALDEIIIIDFEQEQIMRILNNILEGLEFYENV